MQFNYDWHYSLVKKIVTIPSYITQERHVTKDLFLFNNDTFINSTITQTPLVPQVLIYLNTIWNPDSVSRLDQTHIFLIIGSI